MKHLHKHISEVHKEYKPFQCKICPAKFYQGGHLGSKFRFRIDKAPKSVAANRIKAIVTTFLNLILFTYQVLLKLFFTNTVKNLNLISSQSRVSEIGNDFPISNTDCSKFSVPK